ncbi:MAG: hypothetical protein ABI277_15255 [Burkholderiaceae bacterium]
MTDKKPVNSAAVQQLPTPLSKRGNDGGAPRQADPEIAVSDEDPPLSNTDLVQLRIRVVALENLMLAVLAEGTEAQSALAKEMVGNILPRDGYTPHPITIHAAQQMLHLVERASRIKRSE